MLIIDCPYCGPRPELEFAYGGQAHIARPADPSRTSDDEWTAYLYLRKNTRGVHAERWRPWRAYALLRLWNSLGATP